MKVARGVDILRHWGLVVETSPHVFNTYGYLAGTDEDRLADLNAAFADSSIRGVFATRGGYGTQRIIDGLNLEEVHRNPKVVVGFSDVTSLLGRLWKATGLASFYGPVMNWDDNRTGPESIESLRKAVMTTELITINRDPHETTAPVLVPGKASGVLLGGNLTLVETSIGAGDFPDLNGAILLVEEVNEEPYRIDQKLTHLRRVGVLNGLTGVAVGQITNSPGKSQEWDVVRVLKDRLGDLGIPVLGGLRLGHGKGQLTVPLGTKATIDATAGKLTVEAGVQNSYI